MTRTRIALDAQGLSDEELIKHSKFLASQVDSMDDESVAYGAYAAMAVPGERKYLLDTLPARLLLSYRKRLVRWFELALVKRARRGGGGPGIKKVEHGLEEFVAAIPRSLAAGRPVKVSEFVPVNGYLVPDLMNTVGDSILKVVVQDARAAGVLGSNRPVSVNPPIGFTLEYDDRANMWFIPTSPRTFNIRERLKELGFRWNQGEKTWDVQSLTPDIRREFGMVTGSDASRIETWFAEWLSQNIHRFTRIFTDYARNKQSSYALVFTVSNGKAQVSFERDVDTPAKAVEEIRYRYQGRQGREPWLEVIDRFIDLVDVRNPHHVQQLIDRINNLQHSNGLFMEHFPSKVQEWYGGFLNAKFHTPTADELAKQIPDRDLRGLLVEVARNGRRSMDWMYTPTPAYAQMRKELADVGNNVNYRALGYPRPKGMPPVDRFDPEIQSRLDVLQALDTQRERILSTEVASPKQEQAVVEQAHDWAVDREQALESLRAALEAQRRRKLDDPNHAAAWDAINFPDEFIARFPYAVPGASSSELAQFVARYAALGFARR